MTQIVAPAPFDARLNVVHVLKCDSEPYAAVALGHKRAEFRKNDRGFMLGDVIKLCEYANGRCTGKSLRLLITHVQTGYGIPPAYCMLSVELL